MCVCVLFIKMFINVCTHTRVEGGGKKGFAFVYCKIKCNYFSFNYFTTVHWHFFVPRPHNYKWAHCMCTAIVGVGVGAWAWHCLVACGINSFGAISLNCRAGVGIGNRPTLIAPCGGACNNLWHVPDWLATPLQTTLLPLSLSLSCSQTQLKITLIKYFQSKKTFAISS